jgi:hypothetical protein
VASGKWQVASGKWQAASGKRLSIQEAPSTTFKELAGGQGGGVGESLKRIATLCDIRDRESGKRRIEPRCG